MCYNYIIIMIARKGLCMVSSLSLCPSPRTLILGEGCFNLQQRARVLLDQACLWAPLSRAAARHPLSATFRYEVASPVATPAVAFFADTALGHEAYTMTVTTDCIAITYGDIQGSFYAMATLVQLIENCGGAIPCLTIEDAPAFPTRGYMLDIGRNKIPKLQEMKDLVDLLASIKINHLELYIEGVPFEYPSYTHMWQGLDVMSGEDILALDAYCKERFVELVPTQNHFGHMDRWLRKEYRHLAECPDGFTFMDMFFPEPRCLNPLDPRSAELAQGIAEDLLPYFSSNQFNICCDETLELGQGKAKEACEAQGLGRVYLDFLIKVYAKARQHGKKILFWADIIKDFPDLLSELPEDAIALEWGYYPHMPPAKNCQLLQSYGVRYFVCPGTNAWNTMLGRTNQMIANVRMAAKNGQAYGAEGLLNTDWGDEGHHQAIPTSYSGILYGAAMAWSPEESRELDLAGVLDTLIFKDTAHVMGQLILDAGNYFEVEGAHPVNTTHSMWMFINGLDAHHIAEGTKIEDYDRVDNYLSALEERLGRVNLTCDKAELILDELRLAFEVVHLMQIMGRYHVAFNTGDEALQLTYLEEMCAQMPAIIGELRRTWLIRNRYGYLDESVERFTRVQKQAEARIAELKK